ncbi:MAG: triose-phosphate isomerase [Nanobdellota archaeon]
MEFPMIVVNLKTYKSGTGKEAVELAKICEKVNHETGKNIAVSAQAADIFRIKENVSIPVFGQHIDDIDYGSNTGFILPESLKGAGAEGTLINHSEHKLAEEEVKTRIERAKEIGLFTIVCAEDAEKGSKMSGYGPDVIAVEPPELIGGKVSVSSSKPELVKDSVEKINCPVLVGAGVHTKEDVSKALELGAKGVLLASGVTKAEDPERVLKELCGAL